ncbi:hypothetical protein NST50_29665 [Paenibacillus sp. FSL E2-0202]|uniref:hypothetical protein n=1 Tax=Paenibacillus sp. FSL E2-0202 TaxID=2954505 RepID=UPI0030EBC21F
MSEFMLKRDRDAWATIRGYVYQVDLSIKQWIALEDKQVLELERGEDIDVVSEISKSEIQERKLQQIKHREKKITLRSNEAIEALINFYDHLQANPEINLTFRFITNAKIGLERPPLFIDGSPALSVWGKLNFGELSETQALEVIKKIRVFLSLCTKPSSISEDAWSKWIEFLSNALDGDLLGFINKFTWSTDTSSFEEQGSQIEDLLIKCGVATNKESAKIVYEKLFIYVFKLLSKKGMKNLDKTIFTEVISRGKLSPDDQNLLQSIRNVWIQLEDRVSEVEVSHEQQKYQMTVLEKEVEILKNEVGFHNSIRLTTDAIFLDVPLFENFIPRDDLVTLLEDIIGNNTWLALHGAMGNGKTMLATLLVNKLASCLGWIRLRNLEPDQAAIRIDESLSCISSIVPTENRRQWYQDVCASIPRNSIIVLDDLPRTDGKTLLDEQLYFLLQACSSFGIKLLSTSVYQISYSLINILPAGMLQQEEVPGLSDDGITQLLFLFNAPASILENRRLISLINVLTKGHPVLVNSVGVFLNRRNWDFNDQTLDMLFKSEYSQSVQETIQYQIITKLTDKETREFLYRLTLIEAPFDLMLARKISTITPAISNPYERIIDLLGLWVQKDTTDNHIVSPLVSQMGSLNLQDDLQKVIHQIVGKYTIEIGTITPLDAIRAIGHFLKAESYREAGLTVIMSLSQLEEHAVEVDHWGFTTMWVDTHMPDGMDLKTKIMILTKQIIVLRKMKLSSNRQLHNLDILLSQATNTDTYAQMIRLYLASIYSLEDADKAIDYITQVLNSDVEGIALNSQEEYFSNLILVIWLSSVMISTEQQLEKWMGNIHRLPKDQLKNVTQNVIYSESSLHLCDRFWLNESKKDEGLRNWKSILAILERISAFAEELDFDLLWACSIRAQITVMCEFLNNFSSAEQLGNAALLRENSELETIFIIKESLGRQYSYKQRYNEAISWLTEALQHEFDKYPVQRVYAYLELSKAFGEINSSLSIFFSDKAVEICRMSNQISEVILYRILAEHVITLWQSGEYTIMYSYYEEIAERLLSNELTDNNWKGLFVAFGHVSGYLVSVLANGEPPQSTLDGDHYTVPSPGFFINSSSEIHTVFQSDKVFMLSLQAGILARSLNFHERASFWILRAVDQSMNSGEQELIGGVALFALPLLIKEYRFEVALDITIKMQMIFEMYKQKSPLNSDPKLLFSSKQWIEIEEASGNMCIIPSVFRVFDLSDPNEFTYHIKSLISLCHQMELSSSLPQYWTELGKAIEFSLKADLSFKELIRLGNLNSSDFGGVKVIYYIGAALRTDSPSEALGIFASISEYLEGSFGQYKDIYKDIICKFISIYWTEILKENYSYFLAPSTLKMRWKSSI